MKRTQSFVVGLFLGLLREFFVVRYLQAVGLGQAMIGSGLTLSIGIFDLFVIAKMTWQRNLWMAAGYIVGETIGTYLSIMAGK